MRPHWSSSVGARFTLLTLTVVLVVSLMFTVVESWISIRWEVRDLNLQLRQIEESHIPSIVSSLWLTDYELLQSQIDAIERFPHVVGVAVMDDEGNRFVAGSLPARSTTDWQTLTYSRRGTEIEIGRIEIAIDQESVRRSALEEELMSVAGHVLTAILVAAAVALVFERQVGRHLLDLSAYVQSANVAEEVPPAALSRRGIVQDELHALCTAINELRDSQRRHLREKELMMQEVHHRVKNDVVFVKSLLSLQAAQAGSRETKQALQEASDRVAVMGQIYGRLNSSQDFTMVDVRPVAEEIIGSLEARGVLSAAAVQLAVDCRPVTTRLSITFGIILNELVTNSAKYAIRGCDRDPVITVAVSDEQHGDAITIAVKDNGPGFPADVTGGERTGFGLMVVGALAEQYHGDLELSNDGGAHVIATVNRPTGTKQSDQPQGS